MQSNLCKWSSSSISLQTHQNLKKHERDLRFQTYLWSALEYDQYDSLSYVLFVLCSCVTFRVYSDTVDLIRAQAFYILQFKLVYPQKSVYIPFFVLFPPQNLEKKGCNFYISKFWLYFLWILSCISHFLLFTVTSCNFDFFLWIQVLHLAILFFPHHRINNTSNGT